MKILKKIRRFVLAVLLLACVVLLSPKIGKWALTNTTLTHQITSRVTNQGFLVTKKVDLIDTVTVYKGKAAFEKMNSLTGLAIEGPSLTVQVHGIANIGVDLSQAQTTTEGETLVATLPRSTIKDGVAIVAIRNIRHTLRTAGELTSYYSWKDKAVSAAKKQMAAEIQKNTELFDQAEEHAAMMVKKMCNLWGVLQIPVEVRFAGQRVEPPIPVPRRVEVKSKPAKQAVPHTSVANTAPSRNREIRAEVVSDNAPRLMYGEMPLETGAKQCLVNTWYSVFPLLLYNQQDGSKEVIGQIATNGEKLHIWVPDEQTLQLAVEDYKKIFYKLVKKIYSEEGYYALLSR